MYYFTLLKSIPKTLRHLFYGYLAILVVLQLTIDLWSELKSSVIARILFGTSLTAAIFIVVGVTALIFVQRKDTVIDGTKDQIVLLYVELRPEAEKDATRKQAKWQLIADKVNAFVQTDLTEVDASYRKLFKITPIEVKEIFHDSMNYITSKIISDYGSVDQDELNFINPRDKLLLSVRNMYADDLRDSLGDKINNLDRFVFK